MDGRTTQTTAATWTVAFWSLLFILVGTGALVRLATRPELALARMKEEPPKTTPIVMRQKADEEVVVTPAPEKRPAITKAAAAVPSSGTAATERTEESSPLARRSPEPASAPAGREAASERRADSTRATPVPAATPPTPTAATETVQPQSDFRQRLDYYAEVGRSIPEVQRRWARVDIRIDETYWHASAAFGVRIILMATDYDERATALGFDVGSGRVGDVAPAAISERSCFVRELVGDADALRLAKQTAAARLGLARSDDVRVYTLIPEDIWVAQLGKIEDVLLRTHRLHLKDVAQVHVGYERRGVDFDFVVKSIVTRGGRQELVS